MNRVAGDARRLRQQGEPIHLPTDGTGKPPQTEGRRRGRRPGMAVPDQRALRGPAWRPTFQARIRRLRKNAKPPPSRARIASEDPGSGTALTAVVKLTVSIPQLSLLGEV